MNSTIHVLGVDILKVNYEIIIACIHWKTDKKNTTNYPLKKKGRKEREGEKERKKNHNKSKMIYRDVW